ncbi:MAG TPA: hypothetical protein VD999_00635 [Vitreimonas sp.]|nr:hypothetical protein [Vitreimonas sp.]
MKIFFLASIHDRAQFDENYKTLADAAKQQGHTLINDHIFEYSPEQLQTMEDKDLLAYHKKVMDGIKKADAIFAEVSSSSTSVGYLLATAMQMAKPVIIFYSGSKEPLIFRSLEKINDKIEIIRYSSLEDLKNEMSFVIEFINNTQDTRFNFFVAPDHSHYLDWVSKTQKVPRSVYLRKLIDEDMESYPDFEG